MSLVKKILFKNKGTGAIVFILQRQNGLVQVQHVKSGQKGWFSEAFFAERFRLKDEVPEEDEQTIYYRNRKTQKYVRIVKKDSSGFITVQYVVTKRDFRYHKVDFERIFIRVT
jgi:hypothetical protein